MAITVRNPHLEAWIVEESKRRGFKSWARTLEEVANERRVELDRQRLEAGEREVVKQ